MRILLIVFLFLALPSAGAEGSLSDKEQLKQLLQERKDRFDRYMSSLQEKSGWFGGKSKKDLLRSQEILVEIVRLDNRMISVLNRQLDYKNFEKTEMTYNSLQDYEKQNQLLQELNHSRKALAELQKKQSDALKTIRIRTTVLVLAFLTALLAFLLPRTWLHRQEAILRTDPGV